MLSASLGTCAARNSTLIAHEDPTLLETISIVWFFTWFFISVLTGCCLDYEF